MLLASADSRSTISGSRKSPPNSDGRLRPRLAAVTCDDDARRPKPLSVTVIRFSLSTPIASRTPMGGPESISRSFASSVDGSGQLGRAYGLAGRRGVLGQPAQIGLGRRVMRVV